MSGKHKIYYYKIPMSKTVLYYLQRLAYNRGESLHDCIQKTLVRGLILQMKRKERFQLGSELEKIRGEKI